MDRSERELGVKGDKEEEEIQPLLPLDPSPSSSSSLGGGGGHFSLFRKMKLLEFKDKFVIRAIDFPDRGFSVNRFDGIINPLSSDDTLETPTRTSTICGVVGTIRLVAGMYIIVIASSKEVGKYHGFPIYRVESMKYLPCNQTLKKLSGQEKKDEAYFRNLLRVVESTTGLYYSYETDLTVNLQRRLKLAAGWTARPIWKQADPRFVWNKSLLDELIECKLDEFIIPLLQGSYQTAEFKVRDAPVSITLISRRCTHRLGTRMWRRGANLEGDAANFIETEQLVELKGHCSSFLQVEIQVRKIYRVSRAVPLLPFNIEDASRSDAKIDEAFECELLFSDAYCTL